MNIVLFVTILVLNVTFAALMKKSFNITKPSWLFWLYWISNILVAFCFFGLSINWKLEGLALLLIYVDIYVFAYLFIPIHSTEKYDAAQLIAKTRTINYLLIICFVAGIIYAILELVLNGFSIRNLFSISGLTEAGYYFTDGRYGGRTEIKTSTFEQICLTINYSGFILAGYGYRLRLSKKQLCFIQFIPMIASTLATTAKTTVISGIFLWICGYLVACNCRNSAVEDIKRLSKKKVVLISAGLLVIFYISFVVRYGVGTSENIVGRMIMYGLGHVPCYDDWYSQFRTNLFGYSHGQQTFMLLFGDSMPGSLANVYISPRFFTKYSWTNVITLFAYTLMDFGYIGSAVFFAIFGAISKLGIVSLRNKGSAIGHGLTGLVYYIIIYSFLVSPLRYLSITGSFALFGLYIFALQRIYLRKSKKTKIQVSI